MAITLSKEQVKNIKFVLNNMDRLNKKWHDSTLQLYINEVGALLECGRKVKDERTNNIKISKR